MVNPFYNHQVLNNTKYTKASVEQLPNKEVTNVCTECGGIFEVVGIHENEYCSDCLEHSPHNTEL